jgi:23S rRNA pseudouridine955/2504/2580 synthase
VSRVRSLTIADDEADLRLDRWFRRHFPALSHGRLEKLLRTGQVRIDGKRAKAGTRLSPGQAVRVPPNVDAAMPPPATPTGPSRLQPAESAALQARVLFMDEWLIAIDKPPGLAVQGGSGQRRHLDAMADALRFGAPEAPRLVHRLDKDTSGVLLLARNAAAARALTAAFREGSAQKIYWAVVAGVPRPRQGRIDLPLAKRAGRGRNAGSREKMAADRMAGQSAETIYRVVQMHGEMAAWLALKPLTGRTHQLRAHCAALGHPILGDGKYGGKAAFLDHPDLPRRLHLHARELAVPHPADGTTLRVTAPLPPHMEETWDRLGFEVARGDSLPDLGG